MYLLIRGSQLMFYGSKRGGVKIYLLIIYLKKIKKQSNTKVFWVTKSCAQVNSYSLLRGGVWYLTPLSTIFQLYRIVAVSFIGGGNHRPVASH